MRKKGEKIIIIILIGLLIFSIFYFFKKDNFNLLGDNKNSSVETSTLVKLAKGVLSGEKVFLVLFQNNMELRPGGGFIGSFAIIKTKDGKVLSYAVHDTGNFDGRIPENKEMPAPMKKIFKIDSWKLRDSNYSPDFPTNAKKALDFYYQGKGEEKFDGVIAMNANVLEKILEVTGPVRLEGYPVVFESKDALITLEKQVEVDFSKQGIEAGNRKDVMGEFLKELLKKTAQLSKLDKLKLAKALIKEFENKNIQLQLMDENVQALVAELRWDGKVDSDWSNDYLMAVDANLGSYKSDYVIKRSMQYALDLTKEIPEATLKITYNHTGKEKDWMTRDYLTYLRVYVPKGATINSFSEGKDIQYGEEFGKKYVGGFVEVRLNSAKTVELKYILPKEIKNNIYKLKIQKQSGSGIVPTTVDIKLPTGEVKHYDLTLNGDVVVGD